MNTRTLGRTGLKVSELCLGTMHFGWKSDQETSFAILDAFGGAGGNFLQAAGIGQEILTRTTWAGLPEAYIGDWLRTRKVDRHSWIISTRLNLPRSLPGGAPAGAAVRQCCEDALRRLQTDYIDFAVCEWTDVLPTMENVVFALSTLVRAGKLRYFGVAGCPPWRVMEAICHAVRRNVPRPELFQIDFSLLDRSPYEQDAMDLCQEYRLGFLATSPLAGGFLTNRFGLGKPIASEQSRRLQRRYHDRRGRAVLAGLDVIARDRGVTIPQVALAWVLSHRMVTAPVIGVTTVVHLLDAVAATRLNLSDGELRRLELASANPPAEPGQSLRPVFPPHYPGHGAAGPASAGLQGALSFPLHKSFNEE